MNSGHGYTYYAIFKYLAKIRLDERKKYVYKWLSVWGVDKR
jgi:hypothetical protein